MNKKLFIYKDIEQKNILEMREYNTTDNIIAEVLSDYPIIEEIEGKIGKYVLDDDGNIIVEYTDIPKSEVELLQEENQQLEQRMCELQETLASFILEGADK